MQLSFGLNKEIPEHITVAWGARWIYPDDQVWDRQDFKGIETPEGQQLKAWLDNGAIRKAMDKARRRPVSASEDHTVVLFEDKDGIIKGNPQASYGYMYVVGYLRTDKDPKYEPIEVKVGNLNVYYKAPEGTVARCFIVTDKEKGESYYVNEPTYYFKENSRTQFKRYDADGNEKRMTPKQKARVLEILEEHGHWPKMVL